MESFDNFISYRRSETEREANKLFEILSNYGHSVFWDQNSLHAGDFSEKIQHAISNCKNFILLATTRSLLPCCKEDDWIRREIAMALSRKRKIVVLFIGEGFRFPDNFPEEIAPIKKYNGIPFFDVDNRYHIDRLIYEFLKYDRTITTASDFVIEGDELVRFVGSAPIVEIPDGIRAIGKDAFSDATKVNEIHFPDSLLEIGDSAFERCRALTVLQLPANLRVIRRNAFRRCVALRSVYFNEGLQQIEETAFEFCSALRFARLPASLERMDPSAFHNCIMLSKFEVDPRNPRFISEDGILYSADGRKVIRCPENLRTVNLAAGAEVIGRYAFHKSRAETLTIPGQLTRIEDFAFQQSLLRTLHYSHPLPAEVSPNAFIGCEHLVDNPFCTHEKRSPPNPIKNIKPFLILFQYVIVVTTFESEDEAKNMISMLLEKKLIVAGQIRNVRSIYSWNDEICDEEEFEVSCITEGRLYPDVEAFIVANHSYDLCQLYCTPMINTTNEWAHWISGYLENTPHDEQYG